MERSLVAAKVYGHILFGKPFPQVYDVALVCQRQGFAFAARLGGACQQFVKVGVDFVDPALFVAFLSGLGVDFGHNAHNTGYIAGLGLSARHAAKTGRYK